MYMNESPKKQDLPTVKYKKNSIFNWIKRNHTGEHTERRSQQKSGVCESSIRSCRMEKKLAEANRKGNAYSSGMSGPFKEDQVGIEQESEMEAAPTINKKRKRTKKDMQMMQCGHCGRMGHCRPTLFDCLKNPKNMLLVQAEDAKQARKKGTSSRPCVTLSCLCTHFAVLSTVLST
jgi:hypothetical protein